MIRKIIFAILLVFAVANAEAQVTFKPGVRAGANFSNLTSGNYNRYNYSSQYYDFDGNQIRFSPESYSTKVDFYVGIYGALKLTKYYTLQPEINYTRQGSKIESDYVVGNIKRRSTQDFTASYLSVGIINKFTFNKYFNIHIGPTVDILTDKQKSLYYNDPNYDYNNGYSYGDTATDIDLGFVFGFGVNISNNLGFEARFKKGIVPVIDSNDANHTNVVFSAGLNYTFDLQ